MKKKIILRGLLGVPLGVAIGDFITILISLFWGNGYYAPCVPELVSATGTEISAVILQTVLCGVLGAGFAAASVIWECEHWSLLKQTGLYFLIVSLIMMPVAYFTYWMDHTAMGFLSYFGIFTAIFAAIWFFQLLNGRRNVKKMNARLNKEGKDSSH